MEREPTSSTVLHSSNYSRPSYVIGEHGLEDVRESSVLICGAGPLGAEIAKNLILTGVLKIALNDTKAVSWSDLSASWCFKEDQLQQNRAAAAQKEVSNLASAGQSVSATCIDYLGNLHMLRSFNVVIVTDADLNTIRTMGEYCHREKIAFIAADVKGPFSFAFADLGEFRSSDMRGDIFEDGVMCMLSTVTQSSPAIATIEENCCGKGKLPFNEGSLVEFVGVKGELGKLLPNGRPFRIIKKHSSTSFSFECDTSTCAPYERSYCGFVKMSSVPQTFYHLSFTDSLEKQKENPCLSPWLHLWQFQEKHQRLPFPWNRVDADELAQMMTSSEGQDRARLLSYTCQGGLIGLTSLMGGVVAHEAVKAVTRKFTPLSDQWIFHDATDLIDRSSIFESAEYVPRNDQFDSLRICVGQKMCEEMAASRVFVAGAGAIGCELFKCIASLGLCREPVGVLTIADADVIEHHNLSTQFLYRERHLTTKKAKVAAEFLRSQKVQVISCEEIVSADTVSTFSDSFFLGIDCAISAAPASRAYLDSRCVTNQKALIDCGALGAMGSVQTVVPFLSESYTSQQDPHISLLSGHHGKVWFPRVPVNCVDFMAALCSRWFEEGPSLIKSAFAAPDLSAYLNAIDSKRMRDVRLIHRLLVKYRARNFAECIQWAIGRFECGFNRDALKILYRFPSDSKDLSGDPFWLGSRRCPLYFHFDPHNPLHFSFVRSGSLIYAKMFNICPDESLLTIANFLELSQTVPQIDRYTPKFVHEGKNISEEAFAALRDERENEKMRTYVREILSETLSEDFSPSIDFVLAGSLLRMRQFLFPEMSSHQIVKVALRIDPMIVTSAAAAAGLASIELMKIVQKNRKVTLDFCRNSFLNLNVSLVVSSQPRPVKKTAFGRSQVSLWDRLEIRLGGDVTLAEVRKEIEQRTGMDVDMIAMASRLIYGSFFPNHRHRLGQLMSTLCGVPPSTPHVDLTACFSNPENQDEDSNVDGPAIRFYFQRDYNEANTQ